MAQQGRKIRFELTPLEAEAVFAAAADADSGQLSEGFYWKIAERRIGCKVLRPALRRGIEKISSAIIGKEER